MHLGGRRIRHIRVEHFLGQGGMGDVYEGFDEKLRRRVALKVLHRHPGDRDARARLIREAHALSQLEHPNICRIYDLIDDEPDVDVLVLELIDGRTLTQAIRDGLSSAEQLRIATSIADVLVAAHRAGIIHRDLKPDNVMLTRNGVVKVLDFGLARWLERASGKNEAVRLRTRDQSEHGFVSNDPKATLKRWVFPEFNETPAVATAVGIAVGTPLYMSPEQARGETLTTASDMYAYGLVLQTLFSGDEPYPAGWSGAEVMMKAAIGESLPAKLKQREIATLINQLKQLAPSDRPTAVDALAKLKFIAERPRRLVRNGAIAAVISLAVLGTTKYTLDLRHERAVAKAAESEARKRRAQADDLIGFMVGDLRKKLEPVGRLDVLDATATKALEYAGSLDPHALSVAELLRSSEALNQLGEVRIAQGKLNDAMHVFQRSLTFSSAASRRAPENNDAQLALGTSHFWVGNAFRLQGNLNEALRHMRAYMNIAEDLVKREPGNAKYQLERGYGHSTVALILEMRNDLAGALADYRVALAAKEAYALAAPHDLDRQFDLTITLNHIGYALQRLGRLQEARDYFEREAEIFRELIGRDSKQTQWRIRQAINYSYLAVLDEAKGDDTAALANRRAELEIEQSLNAIEPANTDWRRNLGMTQMRIADLSRRGGNLAEARRNAGEAEHQVRQLLGLDPNRTAWKRDLGIVHITQARVMLAGGDTANAMSSIDDSLRLLSPMKDASTVHFISEAHLVRGDILAARGRASDARDAWQQARATIEPYARNSSDPQDIDCWTRSLLRLGDDGAKPLLAHLDQIGYRPRDLVNFSRESRNAAAKGE
ncbi:MAG TPA: protein kinase [Thermoanaerobaculia bacterium]|nr:protein kinase [Thermoanaerobaculia bacterium]